MTLATMGDFGEPDEGGATRFVDVGGVRIAYQTRGSGPPLVLIMGYRLSSSAWPGDFLDAMAQRFTVVTLDNRGTGASDKPVAGYALSNLACDVSLVLDRLGIRRTHVLGYSMGGAIAQEFVRLFPERVDRLVLCATMCGGANANYARLPVIRILRELDGLTPEQASRRIWKVTYAASYLAANREQAERQMLREIANPTPLHAADLQFQALADFDSSAALPSVRAPTLVLTGELDELVPARNSTTLARLIPKARLEIVPGCGHRLLWEDTERCVGILCDFLGTDAPKLHAENGKASDTHAAASDGHKQRRYRGSAPETMLPSWRRAVGLMTAWPWAMADMTANLLVNTVQPIYLGRKIPPGDGKPVVVVPGFLHGDLQLAHYHLWLKIIGYRPANPGVILNLDESRMDAAVAASARSAAERVGRKAVLVAFDTGIKPALRVAARERDYVSAVIGLSPPGRLETAANGVRLHLIDDKGGTATAGGVHRAKPWLGSITANPHAFLVLAELLRSTRIELLNRDAKAREELRAELDDGFFSPRDVPGEAARGM